MNVIISDTEYMELKTEHKDRCGKLSDLLDEINKKKPLFLSGFNGLYLENYVIFNGPDIAKQLSSTKDGLEQKFRGMSLIGFLKWKKGRD